MIQRKHCEFGERLTPSRNRGSYKDVRMPNFDNLKKLYICLARFLSYICHKFCNRKSDI